MNDLTLAQRVLEAVGADESRLPIPRIVSRIPDALLALSDGIAGVDESQLSPSDRARARTKKELLRKTFTATLAGNTAPLVALLTGSDYLLLSSVPAADIFAPEFSQPLQRVPDRSSLSHDRSPVFGYFALEGTSLYTANVADGTLTFKASFVPTLATLPAQLEAELVAVLALMFSAAPQAVAG